jgi:hypothetical protein
MHQSCHNERSSGKGKQDGGAKDPSFKLPSVEHRESWFKIRLHSINSPTSFLAEIHSASSDWAYPTEVAFWGIAPAKRRIRKLSIA